MILLQTCVHVMYRHCWLVGKWLCDVGNGETKKNGSKHLSWWELGAHDLGGHAVLLFARARGRGAGDLVLPLARTFYSTGHSAHTTAKGSSFWWRSELYNMRV